MKDDRWPESAEKRIAELEWLVEAKDATIAQLRARNTELEAENAQLKGWVGVQDVMLGRRRL